jgi:SnoaL-like domain
MSGRALYAAVLAAGILLAGCATGEATPPAGAPAPQPADVQRPQLLAGASAYVDAVARRDADALAAAFAPDGVVVDVQRRIAGREAIREWAAREVIGGSLRVDGVTALGPDVQWLRVHWAPSGLGGWAADYTFTVAGDEIVEADLQYAR